MTGTGSDLTGPRKTHSIRLSLADVATNLRGLNSYLRALICHRGCAQVHSTERQAQDLILDLRELSSKDALALRAQTAAHAAAARQQRQGLERTLYGLAKKGVY